MNVELNNIPKVNPTEIAKHGLSELKRDLLDNEYLVKNKIKIEMSREKEQGYINILDNHLVA